MLWFYLQPRASRLPRASERQMTEAFLDTVFRRVDARQRFWVQQADGGYALSPRLIAYPPGRRDPAVSQLCEQVDGLRSMRELLGARAADHAFCNQARLLLTTSAFPFLEATHGEWI